MPSFSRSSNGNLDTCHPDLQRLFREVVKHFDCKVLEGLRTAKRQAGLYAKGRTAPGPVVTNCDGVTSKSDHQAREGEDFSRAVDVVPYFAKKPHIRWEDTNRFYRFAGFVEATALRLGIKVRWGGDFKSLKGDSPHWELI